MDLNLSLYRVGIRGKKWWFPIFTWLIDTACQNDWLLHNSEKEKKTNLDFRRYVVNHYLSVNNASKRMQPLKNNKRSN